MLVEHDLLPDGVADTQHRSAEHLAAETSRIDHGPDVGHRQEVGDHELAGLDVDLDLGKRGDVRMRLAVARIRRARPPSGPGRRAPPPMSA